MTSRTGLAALALLFGTACVVDGGGGGGGRGNGDRDAEARAEKRCEREAEERGLRVRKVGAAEKVGKKQYEVKLRVDDSRYGRVEKDKKKNKDDEVRVLCRYDDKDRRASIY